MIYYAIIIGCGTLLFLLLVLWDLVPKILERHREAERVRLLKEKEPPEAIIQLAKEKSVGFPWLAELPQFGVSRKFYPSFFTLGLA